ncbi:unnamed protein product, partial [Closterium sp. Yama58-4]
MAPSDAVFGNMAGGGVVASFQRRPIRPAPISVPPAKNGWIALAWPKAGKMAPSDAVFGNMAGGGVAAYKIGGYSMGSIQRTTAFSIGTANTTTSTSGSTVIQFSRTQGTGSAAKVQVAGSNSLLWAYSPSGSKSLGFHGGAYAVKAAASIHDALPLSSSEGENSDGEPIGENIGEGRGRGRVLVNLVTPLATCSPSSLAGFSSSIALGSNMRLHWKVATGSLLELAVTATGAAATGWFGVAFSQSGGMVKSDAIIANQGGSPVPVNTYAVTSYSTVKATTAFSAGGKAFTGGTTATMKFTRSTGDGGVAPVNVRGSNSMVYAYSKSGAKAIAYHGSH